ncbi:zinc-dependent alcohol dehydrogenase [Methylolobus aquaticus]
MKALALMHVAPGSVEGREIEVAEPRAGQVVVQTELSAISPGTESMIFRGDFPSGVALDETIPALNKQGWSHPLHYGYALVGRVVRAGSSAEERWVGRRVFLFHPHQDHVLAEMADCWPVPEGLPSQAAALLPNVESALNFVMDAAPSVGERLLVTGQGVVGLLTTAILAAFPLARLAAVDPVAARRQWSVVLGADTVAESVPKLPRELSGEDDFDGVVEVSGNLGALNDAIARTVFDGRIVVASWYARSGPALDLSGAFHRRRIRLISSQVSTLAPALTGRWTKARRLALAWDWIRRIRPERLVTHSLPAARCQEAFELAAEPSAGALQVLLTYS